MKQELNPMQVAISIIVVVCIVAVVGVLAVNHRPAAGAQTAPSDAPGAKYKQITWTPPSDHGAAPGPPAVPTGVQ